MRTIDRDALNLGHGEDPVEEAAAKFSAGGPEHLVVAERDRLRVPAHAGSGGNRRGSGSLSVNHHAALGERGETGSRRVNRVSALTGGSGR